MEKRECSETSAYKIQTPGNFPEENIQHTEHGKSLKSRIFKLHWQFFISATLPMADDYFIGPFEISGKLILYTQRKPIYLVDLASSGPIANFCLP
jgi:hypothetical protein